MECRVTLRSARCILRAEAIVIPRLRPERAFSSQSHSYQPKTANAPSRRSVQTTASKEQYTAINVDIPPVLPAVAEASAKLSAENEGLSLLPLSQVLRTWAITSISSSPRLLGASTSLLRRMLESQNPLFSLQKNLLMRKILWETFYKQFCGGETQAQVTHASDELRSQGYAGVILEYALEVLKDAEGNEEHDVQVWRKGVLETIQMAAPGDFVGLKWSGMGAAAMRLMGKDEEPTKLMSEAMRTVCEAAAAHRVSLLPAAEEVSTLRGFHRWSLGMQKLYNTQGKSVVYTTYQAYLKQTSDTLVEHLDYAKQQNFTLGVKLVRGAYLGSEDRSLIWPTIEGTHHSYDSIASALIHQRNNNFVNARSWPTLNVMLATHNAVSVQKAQEQRREQAARGETLTPLTFAQLQGMADEISCRLIAASRASRYDPNAAHEKVFKCTTWGPMYECLNYLLRRAAENKDAAGRTHETRNAMKAEIWRRLKRSFGLVQARS